MKIYRSFDDISFDKRTVLTLGTFDGLHLGHRKIIEKVTAFAKSCQCRSMLLTFETHPLHALKPEDNTLRLLSSLDEKKKMLAEMDLDCVVFMPFTKAIANKTGENFVRDILSQQIGFQHIVLGYDHHFGKNQSGNHDLLSNLEKQLDFKSHMVPAVCIHESEISSTAIRKFLVNGNIQKANQYLGYEYNLSGKIITGKGLGRQLGFPTANLKLDTSRKLVPKAGVYAARAVIQNQVFDGTLNIGFSSSEQTGDIEIYLHDFNQDIYGESMIIKLKKYLRDELKFDSLELLKKQIQIDIEQSVQYLNTLSLV